jgi:hypothetical protein
LPPRLGDVLLLRYLLERDLEALEIPLPRRTGDLERLRKRSGA